MIFPSMSDFLYVPWITSVPLAEIDVSFCSSLAMNVDRCSGSRCMLAHTAVKLLICIFLFWI